MLPRPGVSLPNLFPQPPISQALPGFGYDFNQPPGQPGPFLFAPPGFMPPFMQPTPPSGPPPGLGGLSTPAASAAQTEARRVRAWVEKGAPDSALSRFRGFDEAESPNGDSSELSGMDTEREGAAKRGELPGNEQASLLHCTTMK